MFKNTSFLGFSFYIILYCTILEKDQNDYTWLKIHKANQASMSPNKARDAKDFVNFLGSSVEPGRHFMFSPYFIYWAREGSVAQIIFFYDAETSEESVNMKLRLKNEMMMLEDK